MGFSYFPFIVPKLQIRKLTSRKGGSSFIQLVLFSLTVSGGRSRLHLLDLGSCEKVLSKSRDGGGGLCLSLNALGNVIMALTNGAKHVPYR